MRTTRLDRVRSAFVDLAAREGIQAPPASAGPGSDTRIDSRWRWMTEAGNRAFADGDDIVATRHYACAMAEAERLFELALENGGPPVLFAPMVYTIACHNAGEAMKRSGDEAGCRDLKLLALQKLIAVAASAASPLSLRVNCVRHLKHGLALLAREDFATGGHAEDAIQTMVTRARAVAAAVFRAAGHATSGVWGADNPDWPDPRAVQ